MGKAKVEDPVMAAVRERFEKTGWTQQELGERMGYSDSVARQAVFQFLKSGNPKIDTLRRFAEAVGISVRSLL
jgi:transcriptional regulator with XRE-family HTH domain